MYQVLTLPTSIRPYLRLNTTSSFSLPVPQTWWFLLLKCLYNIEIQQRCSVHGPQLSVTWKCARNVNCWAPPQNYWTRNFGVATKTQGVNQLWSLKLSEALRQVSSWICETEGQERLEIIEESSAYAIPRAQLRSPGKTLERGQRDYRKPTMRGTTEGDMKKGCELAISELWTSGKITRKTGMLWKQEKVLSMITIGFSAAKRQSILSLYLTCPFCNILFFILK